MRRQRSLQKGRHFDVDSQATDLPQVGQGTVVGAAGLAFWLFILLLCNIQGGDV